MPTALEINPDISLGDLLDAQFSNEWSIQFNPLARGAGGRQGATFIKSAVAWKGQSYDGFDEAIDGIQNDGVTKGLSNLQDIAETAGNTGAGDAPSGVALLQNRAGDVYPAPASAAAAVEAAQAEGYDTDVSVYSDSIDEFNSVRQALRTTPETQEVEQPTVA